MNKYITTIKSDVEVLDIEDKLMDLTDTFDKLKSFREELYNIGIRDGEFGIYTLKEFEEAWNSTDDDLECLNILNNYLKIITIRKET